MADKFRITASRLPDKVKPVMVKKVVLYLDTISLTPDVEDSVCTGTLLFVPGQEVKNIP